MQGKGETEHSIRMTDKKEELSSSRPTFLGSAKISDLRQVFQYFAEADGRVASSSKPSSIDPLVEGETQQCDPRVTANVLASFFQAKMKTRANGLAPTTDQVGQNIQRVHPHYPS